MQLRLDAADRLVELVEERRGPVPADEAARLVLKLGVAGARRPRAVAARRSRSATTRGFAGPATSSRSPMHRARRSSLEQATFVVFDLETTGLRPASARPCEIGAVRVRELELEERFQTLANPGARLDPAIVALTGLRDAELRRAPPVQAAVRRFLGFAGDAVLVAHNARFDMAFLDNETMRATGRRVAATGRRHRRARPPPARSPAREPRGALVPLRDRRAAVPPRAARRGGDRRDPALPDRHGPGARRAHRCRSGRAGARHGRGASTASEASPSARRSDPACTCSATCTTRCSTSDAHAICARVFGRTSVRSGSDPPSRRHSVRSSASSGGRSARRSRRRSRSSG